MWLYEHAGGNGYVKTCTHDRFRMSACKSPKEKFGYLLRRKDPVDWSEKMNLILSNQEFSKSLGENGRKVALKDFNIQTFNKNLISFIKVLLR